MFAPANIRMFALFAIVVLASPQMIVMLCESTPPVKFVMVVALELFVWKMLPMATEGVVPVIVMVCLFEIPSVRMRPWFVCASVRPNVTRHTNARNIDFLMFHPSYRG